MIALKFSFFPARVLVKLKWDSGIQPKSTTIPFLGS